MPLDNDGLALIIADVVKAATAPLLARIAILEARQPLLAGQNGLNGRDGLNGKDGAAGLDGEDGASGLNGKDGAPGIDGKDGAPGLNGKDGAAGRDGTDGAPGLNGKDGLNGADGAPGRDGTDAAPWTREQVIDALKAMPDAFLAAAADYFTAHPITNGRDGVDGKDGIPGINGRDGVDGLAGKDGAAGLNGKDGAAGQHGEDGADGINGKDGADGVHGKDGIGLAGALLTREGHLALTLSDGTVRELGPVVGKDGTNGVNGTDGSAGLNGKDGASGLNGKDGDPGTDGRDGLNGKDVDLADVRRQVLEEVAKIPHPRDGTDGVNGKDGLGFDDLSVRQDETGWYLCFVQGDRRKEFPLPYLADRGVWKAGTVYLAGHFVTWNGSLWIAKQETTDRPGNGATAWRLAVKSGAEGKQGPKGDPGHDGRDLTQMDTTGRKW